MIVEKQIIAQICIWLFAAVSVGCGTEVSVGRNSDPRYFDNGEDEFLTTDNEEGGVTQGGSADGVALSCFGTAPEMPAPIADLCGNTPAQLRTNYENIFEVLCTEKRLVNLVEPSCGWDGSAETLGRHLKVLDHTELSDSAVKEFDFFAAGSVVLPRTVDKYLWAFYEGYENPEFRARLKIYDKVKLSELSIDRDAGAIDYTVEISTSAATVGFRGRIDVRRYESGLVAIFDRAVDDFRIVKEDRFVTLIAPVGDDEIVVAIIDQKKVDDLGNHRIAFQSSIGFDKERMQLMHAMAVYDEE